MRVERAVRPWRRAPGARWSPGGSRARTSAARVSTSAHRALQRQRAQHRQHHLVLRAQARAEAAAHEGRHDAHIVRLHVEHAAEIALHVLHALRLVVDGELAVAVPHRGRGEQLHRIVVLGRDEIFGLVAHVGRRKGLRGVAARLLGLLDDEGLVALRMQIGDVRLLLVFDAHQRGGEARGLPLLGQHQRDRLAAEHDPVVVERAERRALLGRDIVLVGLVVVGHRRPVLVGEHVEHALDAQRLAGVDARDAALGDGRVDDAAIGEAGDVELAGIFGLAGDLGAAVDAGGRLCRYRVSWRSPDLLVGLRLRRAARGLRQRAHDGAARQLDLEGVVRRSPWRRAAAGRRLARSCSRRRAARAAPLRPPDRATACARRRRARAAPP